MANATVTVLEADGTTETDVVVLDVGRQAAAASKSTAMSTEDKAVLDAIATSLAIIDNASTAVTTINGVAAAFGAGNKGATVLRVVNSDDDPIITAIQGTVAHDSADAGNGSKIAAKAESGLAGITLVADADRTDLYSDLDGVAPVKLNAMGADCVSGNASNTDGTSTEVLAAGAANVKHCITDVTITNTSASNIYVELKDGATTKWTFPVPANSGVCKTFATPLRGTAATAWNFDPSAAATTIYCSVSGFKSKV
jgi:hypothetical protein